MLYRQLRSARRTPGCGKTRQRIIEPATAQHELENEHEYQSECLLGERSIHALVISCLAMQRILLIHDMLYVPFLPTSTDLRHCLTVPTSWVLKHTSP